MIRVVGEGVTTTDLEYYAEAEPRFLKLREDFRAGKRTREEVIDVCRKAVGPPAVARDMKTAGIEGLGPIDQITKFVEWQEANPLRPRLYGSPGVVAALVLAPPDATEVQVVREAVV